MKKLIPIPLAALAACAMPGGGVELPAEARADLVEAVEGRIAGEPVSCIPLRQIGGNRAIGDQVIIFEEKAGDTIWINRPAGGCPLDSGRALSLSTTASQLCSGEIVGVFDPLSGMSFGGCSLGEFVPYREID